MKNKYIINGDITTIYVYHKGEIIDVLIDTDDLPKVSYYNGTWMAKHDYRNIYISMCLTNNKARKFINIHKIIMGDNEEYPLIDHRNGNTLDNRKDNLRFCTCQQNNMNRKSRKGSTSKYKGVSWSTKSKKWDVGIYVDKKTIHLGMYKSEDEAALVYNRAASFYFGEFARLNEVS